MKRLFFNRALRILLITNGLVLLAAGMLAPIYALFVENVGGNLLDASLTMGLFALAAGVTTLYAGKIADKSKRDDRIVAIGYLVISICFVLYVFADSVWYLFGVQLLMGFAEAFYSPAFDALYSKHVTKTKAGREWGAWESINYFSIAIGAVVGGYVATYFGFSAVFLTMAALCFLSSMYIFRLPKYVL